MSTFTDSLWFDNTTLAHFVSWGQGISTRFGSGGFVQTADTGQVNWGTIVTVPTVSATLASAVYEIWRSNDGLTQYFIKIEYGTCAANVPGIAITIGTGTNGSGTLTGNVSTRELILATGNTAITSGSIPCYFSVPTGANGSYFWTYLWQNGAGGNAETFFGFERSKDNNGADTNLYVTYIKGNQIGSTSGNWIQNSVFLSGVPPVTGIRTLQANTVVTDTTTTSWQVSTNIPLAPVFPNVGYFGNPLLGVVGIRIADAIALLPVSCTQYGATHTYLIIKPSANPWSGYFGGTLTGGTMTVAFRWE